jgi:malonate-semialdehyde dehydrogenase (acetylating)/methylmalonate-semialdehyde dehydrogenase
VKKNGLFNMKVLDNFINGVWVSSQESGSSDVINPATQEILAKVPHGAYTAKDAAQAIDAAAIAFRFLEPGASYAKSSAFI